MKVSLPQFRQIPVVKWGSPAESEDGIRSSKAIDLLRGGNLAELTAPRNETEESAKPRTSSDADIRDLEMRVWFIIAFCAN